MECRVTSSANFKGWDECGMIGGQRKDNRELKERKEERRRRYRRWARAMKASTLGVARAAANRRAPTPNPASSLAVILSMLLKQERRSRLLGATKRAELRAEQSCGGERDGVKTRS